MRGEVVALDPADYARWLAAGSSEQLAGPVDERPTSVDRFEPREPLSLPRAGVRAAAERGCLRCHTLDGTPHIGPTWLGLYRSSVPLSDGTAVIADEAYLTESMMDPLARIHRGFPAGDADLPGGAALSGRGVDRRAHQVAARYPRGAVGASLARPGSAARRTTAPRTGETVTVAEPDAAADRRPPTWRSAALDYLRADSGVWSWLSRPITSASRSCSTSSCSACSSSSAASSRSLLRIELLTPTAHRHGRHDLQPHVHAARRDHGVACS